jgi:hypothetical protein
MPIRSAVLADRDTDLSGFVIPSARERLRKPLVSSRADWVDGGTEAAALLKLHRTLSAAARILGIAEMTSTRKTVIVTGGSRTGIGAGLVKAFLDRGYNVVANARKSPSRAHSRRRKNLRWSTEASPKRPPRRRSPKLRRANLDRLMRWSTTPASISRNTSRITRSTIFDL